jgi:hypothetical protein
MKVKLVLAVITVSLLASVAACAAQAVELPQKNCPVTSSSLSAPLNVIDACRHRQHLSSLVLPSNWKQLSVADKLFTMVNIERVARHEPPIVGLSEPLTRLAVGGASHNTDPELPSGYEAGGVWAGVPNPLVADIAWLYTDGYGRTPISNEACISPHAPGCWGHARVLLLPGSDLVAGAAATPFSYTMVVAVGYPHTDLTFTWAREQHYLVR